MMSRRALRRVLQSAVFAGVVAFSTWPTQAQAQTHVDLVCPCKVETNSLTSINISFGLRNFRTQSDSGPLTAVLGGWPLDSEGNRATSWWEMARIPIPAVAANSTQQVKEYTTAFTGPVDRYPGSYELMLQIRDARGVQLQTIRWIAEPVELGFGGRSYAGVYFDGVPTLELGSESAELTLPTIKNAAGGSPHQDVEVMLMATTGPSVDSAAIHNSQRHSLNQDLAVGQEIAGQSVTLPFELAEDDAYVHVMLVDGATNRRIAFQTVSAPDDEALPTRTIDTGDASLRVDSDGDGVGDVNERLAKTDPDDAESTPEEPTIDVLALYTPGFPKLYRGNPTTRISHVLNVTENIFGDSDVGLSLRLVGIVEAQIDDPEAVLEQQVNEEFLREAMESHGADVAVLFHALIPGSGFCGWAPLFGRDANGVITTYQEPLAHVIGNCRNRTTAHEIGHMMGLGHSFAQSETGTYRWSRGHGVHKSFVSVMAYSTHYGNAPAIDVFSSPDRDCEGQPCGVDIEKIDGADATTSLNITRFQVAGFRAEQPDSDRDGFVDPVDAFPNDADEHLDTDEDGTGNNADTDDDGDGIADSGDAFPLDAAEWADSDGDAVGDNADAFPNDRYETLDSDGDGVGDNTDRFPDDPMETVDTDNDGVGNNGDAFPYDTREWRDTDGDGVGDNADDDADGDGVADASDVFPFDATRSESSSYRINLPHGSNQSLSLSSAGDIDDDGRADFLIGAVHYDYDGGEWESAAYLMAAGDLAAADAADGTADRIVDAANVVAQSRSWKFVDENEGTYAGIRSVAMIGDVDGDDVPELLVGAPSHRNSDSAGFTGAAYLVSLEDLPAADAADGTTDGVIRLDRIPTDSKSWMLFGEAGGDQAGYSVGPLGDIDGDHLADLAIGAPGRSFDPITGSTYLIAAADLKAADQADGDDDGVIELGRMAAQTNSWKLTGEVAGDFLGATGPQRHLDSNDNLQLLLSARRYTGSDSQTIGAAYVVAVSELAAADPADGTTDGVVELAKVVLQPTSLRIVGDRTDAVRYLASLGDQDGDSTEDLLVRSSRSAFFVSGAHLMTADAGDGDADGQIAIHTQATPNTWNTHAGFPQASNNGGVSRGDIDGDSRKDILIQSGSSTHLVSGTDFSSIDPAADVRLDDIAVGDDSWRFESAESRIIAAAFTGDVNSDSREDLLLGTDGTVYLVISTELSAMDAADDQANGSIGLSQLAGDADGDGVDNILDSDDDNDGVLDYEDVFPQDANEWADADGDGVGDNTDAFPQDWNERFDTDGDGIGDGADTDDDGDGQADQDDEYPLDTDNDGTDNVSDPDDDNDGVADADDAFPWDASESVDTDKDGIGDAADPDDDNDGVADADDALPLNPDESLDSDGDGYGDNIDAFDDDAQEWADFDGDGTGDNADTDDDNDGTLDAADAFPFDASETADADGDGIGDHADAFPMDAAEWTDSDADGTGDNADTDDDNDGYTDNADAFPLDSSRQRLFYYRLSGEKVESQTGNAVSGAGDMDGDGIAEVLIGAPRRSSWGGFRGGYYHANHGAAYVVSGADLETSDAADGLSDGRINLARIPAQPKSWAITGEHSRHHFSTTLSTLGDIDSDGFPEWLAGGRGIRHGADDSNPEAAAFLISPADMADANAVDTQEGVVAIQALTAQPNSWEFLAEHPSNLARGQVSSAGDVDGDGTPDIIVGVPDQDTSGVAYVVSGAHLAASDSADGTEDGRIDFTLTGTQPGIWKFSGENDGDLAGGPVSSAGDIDGDGKSDLLIGANGAQAVYLVAASDLGAADLADGDEDHEIGLGNISMQSGSWKILGEVGAGSRGFGVTAGDIDGDGTPELIISSPGYSRSSGSVYIVAISDLAAADASDGSSDHVVGLGAVAALPNSWKLLGEGGIHWSGATGCSAGQSLATFDLNGDAAAEVLISAPAFRDDGIWCPAPGEQRQPGAVYLISGSDLAAADGADGVADGVARLEDVVLEHNSWKFSGEDTDSLGSSVASAGDLDGDGRSDLVFGAAEQFGRYDACGSKPGNGLAIVLSSGQLDDADRADGAQDGVVDLQGLRRSLRANDFDYDGTEDDLDADDDGDGTPDATDAFPYDPLESSDNDGDGIGDKADPDDDNDGTLDADDAFPLNSLEIVDSDGDGTGDNADPDDDNDGTNDSDDAFPFDATETTDSDGDGIGDNADSEPNEAAVVSDLDTDGDGTADRLDADDDNDGVDDAEDLFDLDATKSDLFFYKLANRARGLSGTDFDGDGLDDLVVGSDSKDRTVYLVSSAELGAADRDDGTADRVIDFDQLEDRGGSWEFSGLFNHRLLNWEIHHIGSAGDYDLDGKDDLVLAGRNQSFLIPSANLDIADGADGDADHVIHLSTLPTGTQSGALVLSGSSLGSGVYSSMDMNADGYAELFVGELWVEYFVGSEDYFSNDESVYVISGSEWSSSDGRDGAVDGRIDLDRIISRPTSWKLENSAGIRLGASFASCGDINGDGVTDVAIGAPGYTHGIHTRSGAIFVLSGGHLNSADAADGETDGQIDIAQSADALIWKLVGSDLYAGVSTTCGNDVDGDGLSDLLVEAEEGVYLIAGGDLAAADAADGAADGVVEFVHAIAQPGSRQFRSTVLGGRDVTAQAIGDMDGDGLSDVLLLTRKTAHLVSGHDLPALEAVDGLVNIDRVPLPSRSWKLVLSEEGAQFTLSSSTADLNGDGNPELVLETWRRSDDPTTTYVISPSELNVAAALQGLAGNIIYLDQIARRWEAD